MKTRSIILCVIFGSLWLQGFSQDISSLDTYIEKADYGAAVKVIDSALKDTTLSPSVIRELSLQKAKCLKKLFKYNTAAETLAGILEAGDAEVMAELADCHAQAGRNPEALVLYNQLAFMNPGNLYYKVQKAALEFRSGEYASCIRTGKEIYDTDTIPTILTLVAGSYNQLGQRDSALAYYGKVLQITPYSRGTITSMSNIYLQKKDYDSVISLTESYLDEMEDWTINPILGLAQYLKGDYKDAYDTFYRQVHEGMDDTYSTYYNYGLVNLALNQTGYAEEYFGKAFEIDSSDVNLIYNIGLAKVRGMRSPESLEYFDKALEMMKPDSTMMYKIYSGRALANYKKFDFKNAIPDYVKAYSYNPSYTAALTTIGYCYEQLKDYNKAKEYYESYLKVGKEGTQSYQFAKQSLDYIKGKLFMEETE